MTRVEEGPARTDGAQSELVSDDNVLAEGVRLGLDRLIEAQRDA